MMAQSERIQLCGQRAPPLDAAPRSSQRWRRNLLQLRPCAGPSSLPPNATVAKLGPQDRVYHASLLPFDKINGSAIYRLLQELSISALLHMYGLFQNLLFQRLLQELSISALLHMYGCCQLLFQQFSVRFDFPPGLLLCLFVVFCAELLKLFLFHIHGGSSALLVGCVFRYPLSVFSNFVSR
jgi:hypothetical protein